MAITEQNLQRLLETQSHILEELETLRYGDLKESSFGAKAADWVVTKVGSWNFIIIQGSLLIVWMILNVLWANGKWDPFPFILLNLMLSFQAAFSSPLILMASNRSGEKDRRRAIDAYRSIAHIEQALDRLAGQVCEIDAEEDTEEESAKEDS